MENGDGPWVTLLESYANNPVVRALVQAVPHVGSSIDTLLSHYGAEIRDRRIRQFLDALADQIRKLEDSLLDRDFLQTEEFRELIWRAIELASQERSREKRIWIACIITGAVNIRWPKSRLEETHELLEIIASLTPTEALVLRELKPVFDRWCAMPKQEGHEVRQMLEAGWKHLGDELPEAVGLRLPSILSRLQGKGLLKEFVGSYIGYGGGVYGPTMLYETMFEALRAGGLIG